MRCKSCPAYEYPVYFESYEPYEDEYCKIQDIEEVATENSKDELGCKLHYKTIQRKLKE